MKQQFVKDTAGVFQTYIYENNRKVSPASAAITVYKPGSTDKLIDGEAMTIGPDGLLSYNLTAGDNADADENYKAVLEYVYGSKTYYLTLFYDVVRTKLSIVITDADLTAELPQLKDSGWRVHGAAESGTAASFVDSELKRYEDGCFTGGLAHSLDKDETREITGFASSSGTVTTTAFSTAIGAGEKYILTRPFSREIQRAFEKLEEEINRSGKRAHLILDPYDLREAHIYRSVAEACKCLIKSKEDMWWMLWNEYEAKAEEAFKGISLKYDARNDGYVSQSEESAAFNRLKAVRG